MKTILLLLSCFILANPTFARHGKGGSITYEYLGTGSAPGTSKYRIITKHYIDCDGTQFIEAFSFVGIFDAGSNNLLKTLNIAQSSRITIKKLYFNPCINQPPVVCYVVVTYSTETEIADNIAGYVVSEQECCRIAGIINIQNSSAYGITNTNIIPGVINGIVYRANSSPVFAQKDTVVICHNSYFTLDFSATDNDGDSLAYAFCPAKTGGTAQIRQPNPPSPPPYSNLPYAGGFTAAQPLGSGVSINGNTGIISGIAPSTLGSYVISVNVYEYRNGILISTGKKEVHVTVTDCSLSGAQLKPSYINCNDFIFHFENESSSTNVSKYYWDFGVPNITTDTSTYVTPTYIYADTGKYVLKLKVSSVAGCEDSATADVIVYPGFHPAIKETGICFQSPFQFYDISYAQYGTINSWLWDFADNNSLFNSSAIQNPLHQFTNPGNYKVILLVGSTKGCSDTVSATVLVSVKPLLSLPFRDTLICSIDTLALHANGNGVFSWAPVVDMLNPNSASPLVFPKNTTKYLVTLDENGCIAKDSLTVKVLDYITVTVIPDTTICKKDSIQLRLVSEALQYQWLPNTGLNNSFIKNPEAAPGSDITYHVIANLGKCQAQASVNIEVAPYPVVSAGSDTTICYGTFARLNGFAIASSATWTPAFSLQNANNLSASAAPVRTTTYVLTAYDTLGCPKPSRDTMVVFVLPRINAFAGNDTLIVTGQPLQLNAAGGMAYSWSPGTGLSNAFVVNPVAMLDPSIQSITYAVLVSNGACSATDSVTVKIFKTGADIFVPSAFTPNGDGKNDLLKPILVGIKNLETFKVYNRWGQVVYSTNQAGQGWNGNISGLPQPNAVFVYIATGTTYLDQKIIRKGTVLLLR